MTREEFFTRIEPYRSELAAAGIVRIGVFGSVARNETRSDSDVDVLVELAAIPSLYGYIGLKHRLEDILSTRVDLFTAEELKPRIRDRILAEVRYAA